MHYKLYYSFITLLFDQLFLSTYLSPHQQTACWTTGYDAPESQDKFLSDEVARNKFQNAPSIQYILESKQIEQYGCIFLCGGHGCIDDFYMNDTLRLLVEYVHNKTKGAVGSVCHGCIGLIGCKLENGNNLLKGKFVAVFSNEEEGILNLQGVLPRQCEDLVDSAGAICVPQAPWKPNAVVDGRLASGQNPASSLEATQRCLDILRSLGAKFSPLKNENKPWGK